MKNLKSPTSMLQVARLYRPTVEGVKREILRLVKASPPFSYDDLYRMTWDLVKGFCTHEQVAASIGQIGQKVKRESYLRALAPTHRYFSQLSRLYSLQIEPRSYSVGRGLRVPFAPPMVCGTPSGQIVPWLMFWKINPLNEEQMALFISMALEVMKQEGDLEDAELIVVDTSNKALDKGMPKVLRSSEVSLIQPEKMKAMLEVFVQGFALASQELMRQARVAVVDKEQADADPTQIGLLPDLER